VKLLGLTLVAAAAVALAGCGGSKHAQSSACAQRQARAVRVLNADLVALRRAADRPTKDTLKGNAATSRATDRFLLDLAKSPLDNLARNRMIDHAAAAVAASCQQCFQALEAARPIPAIAHGARGSCSK